MPPRPPAPVTVAKAEARDVPVYLEEIGRVVPIETVAVMPQVGGKVIAAHVADGSFVRKGDPMFELDPRPFKAALASAEAALEQSKAELALAEIEFKRIQGLSSKSQASQIEFDRTRIAQEVAAAKVHSAEAAVETARLNLEYTTIASPISGRAAWRMVDPGNVVKPNEATMQMIRRLDPIYVEFTVPENDLAAVRRSMAAAGGPAGRLRVEVTVPKDSSRVFSAALGGAATSQPEGAVAAARAGELTFLDNVVQGGTGTVKLRATVANEDYLLWPGQFVNVRLVLETRQQAVLVPANAEQIGQRGPFVYVVTADDTAELRPIMPGQRQGELLVVEQGLKAGERVIVSGQMSVTPSGKVKVMNEPAANATADARS
jgi:multidrug efflux system membrane fusion protein